MQVSSWKRTPVKWGLTYVSISFAAFVALLAVGTEGWSTVWSSLWSSSGTKALTVAAAFGVYILISFLGDYYSSSSEQDILRFRLRSHKNMFPSLSDDSLPQGHKLHSIGLEDDHIDYHLTKRIKFPDGRVIRTGARRWELIWELLDAGWEVKATDSSYNSYVRFKVKPGRLVCTGGQSCGHTRLAGVFPCGKIDSRRRKEMTAYPSEYRLRQSRTEGSRLVPAG